MFQRLILAMVSLCFALSAQAATFTVTGSTLAINLTAANEAVAITAGVNSYTFALTGGTWTGTDSADATGNGTASLSALKASFTAVTVDDGSTGNAVTFNTSGANTYDSSFTITLDSTSPGTSTFTGTTAFSGSAALFVQSGGITANTSSVVSVVNGNLSLIGNMQTPGRTGNFDGVNISSAQVKSTGTGNVTIRGKTGISSTQQSGVRIQGTSVVTGGLAGSTLTVEGFGSASTTRNEGVFITGTGSVTTLGGNVVINATGGSGNARDNKGFFMDLTGTSVSATGNGSITIVGNGGGTNSDANTGAELLSGSQITTANGNLSVTAIGGGGGTGAGNTGIWVAGSVKSTGSGNVSVTGTGGPGSGGGNFGVVMQRNGTGTVQEIKSGTGNVTVTGTAGGGTGSVGILMNSVSGAPATVSTSAPGGVALVADSMSLVTSAVISAPTVSIAPKTAIKNMDLGSTSDTIANTLALSQAELNTITASTLNLGDANTVAINVSAAVTLPGGTTANLTAAVINLNGNTISGGTVNQSLSGQPLISVEQPAGTSISNGATTNFGSVVVGSTADLVYTVKNSGSGDLTGLITTGLSGTDFSVVVSPTAPVAPAGSTTFTIRFAPTGLGARTAALALTSNALGVPSFAINLTGTGAAGALSGTRSVGPTGDYASLTAAISAIQANSGPTGAFVLELQPTYVSTVETFPLVFSNLGTTAVNTLTIRPQAGATALSIPSADTTAATVDLNGAQFVTLDGRPGGMGSHAGSGGGTASQLTIENTSTSGIALRFINEASSNSIRYTRILSANANRDTGTVLFSTTTGANGNDNNIIDHCDIGDGASTPATGLHSLNPTATTEQFNSGNVVSNCNVFNFHSTTTSSAGVFIDSGSKDWTLTGNSFYQTVSRTSVPSLVRAIIVFGEEATVTGNFIGGSAPNAGGPPWTATGTSTATVFCGISIGVTTVLPSNVQGNTIANMIWTTASTSGPSGLGIWNGIFVSAGNVNIGTVTGNTIGSGTGTGSISVTTSGTGGTTFGIAAAGTGTRAIANNTIGSITTSGTDTTISASFTGISVTGGANTISNNLVGSTTTANSLNAATSSTSTTGQRVMGIISSSTTSAIITGNTVANLNNNYAGSNNAGHIRGISTSAGVNTVTGNTVRNLSTTSQNVTTGLNATLGQSVVGIAAISSAAGQTVSQNTVHSLANTAASAAVSVAGVYFLAGTSTGHVIARNFVHSLAVSSSSPSSQLTGMQFFTGSFTAQNNLVRVGLDASGSSTAGASIVRGIFDNSTTAGRNFYHNSVYLGGTLTTGSASSRAFDGTSGVSNTRTYQNNLFVNARSNSGGTGKHYAVQYGGTGTNTAGLTSDGNLFLASGTGGVLGFYNVNDRTTLAAWQTATGQDATSYNADPRFIHPTGTAASVDLHLQTVNPAEAKGVAGTGVTDDFDGQARADNTATDIGADAGNFIYAASSAELNPLISFTPAANITRAATRVLSAFATITDDGAIATGPDAPRLYFKKSSEADAFGANTSAANGWKYVTASNSSSPYDFTIDYSLLTSTLSIGDVIQYFIVAQDSAGNFASSPSGAAYSSAAAPVTTVNARPATVQSYLILSRDLSTLTLSRGTLAPVFAPGTTIYSATVANSVSSLLVSPTPEDPTATVTVNGTTPASPVDLSVGANTVTIVVTASDSTTKTYTVTLTRNTIFQDWAAANSTVANNTTLLNFAFGTAPGSGSALIYTGTFAGGGAITATGTPITASEPTTNGLDFRALFVRRKDYVAAGLTYTPQFSANLTTWQNNVFAPTVLADDGIYQIVSVPYPPFVGGRKARFFQVSITVAP